MSWKNNSQEIRTETISFNYKYVIPLQPIFDLLTFSNVNLDKCMTIINRRIIRDRLALCH